MILLFLLPLIAGGVLLWIWQRLNTMDRELSLRLDQLESRVSAMKNDLSGLCSGAVGVDARVSSTESRVRALISRLEEMEVDDQDDDVKTYQRAIQMAQQGATVDQLVEEFQLTTDEAGLLIRLYQMES